MLAREREWSFSECAADDLDAFDHPVDSHARRVVVDAGLVVVGLHPASANAELHAALGEHVQGGDLLGKDDRMFVVVVPHQCTDAQGSGCLCCSHQCGHRRQLISEVIRHRQRGESEILNFARE